MKGDKYYTPPKPVARLLPFLPPNTMFAEPCAGRGDLITHLSAAGHTCVLQTDLEPQRSDIAKRDAMKLMPEDVERADYIITNFPWTRALLHPLIWHSMNLRPLWCLHDADWAHTRQAGSLLRHCTHIVSAGRVRWMEGTDHDGYDNACWYRFDRTARDGPRFYGWPTQTELPLEVAAE